jgi:hypothetical protein
MQNVKNSVDLIYYMGSVLWWAKLIIVYVEKKRVILYIESLGLTWGKSNGT